ncbi:MAG: ATP-dependent zinc metalloprotease FtsH [bacterium]|nr:ATP-dependent zinc metalloprotease FtsH [bacterium]
MAAASRPNRPRPRMFLWMFMFGLLIVLMMNMNPDHKTMSLNELDSAIKSGKVESLVIYPESRRGIVTLKTGDGGSDDKIGEAYDVLFVNDDDVKDIKDIAVASGIKVKVEPPPSNFFSYIIMLLPIFLIVGFIFFMMRSAGSGAGNMLSKFSRSNVDFVNPDKIETTMSDVGGCAEAKQELMDLFMSKANIAKHSKVGARLPKGVLLVGRPGCGKTLLAKATVKEVGLPFGFLSGSDFVEMFVGVGASRVRDLFRKAEVMALHSGGCVIFIDEIDAIGGRRHTLSQHTSNDEKDQTLNAILSAMDGFGSDSRIIVIGATNRPEILDPALVRAGRFDRKITIPLPDLVGREEILAIHARKSNLADNVDFNEIAKLTTGSSGADLAAIVNEAGIIAARAERDSISHADFREAVDKQLMGFANKSICMDYEEKKSVAYHEAGHTLVALNVGDVEPFHKVTILPRGQSLGATYQLPEKDRYLTSKKKLVGQLAVLMGGRVAEELCGSGASTGAANDFERATQIATAMVCQYGMSDELGNMSFARSSGFLGMSESLECSPETRKLIDDAIRKFLGDAYERAKEILTEHRQSLDKLASALVERETLDASDIEQLLSN